MTNAPDITLIGSHVRQVVAFAIEFTLTVSDGRPSHRAWHQETGLNLWDCQD